MGLIFSPIPCTRALWAPIKKGISAPKELARVMSSALCKCKFQRWLSANKAVAAPEIPPPHPGPKGIIFFRKMRAPFLQPVVWRRAFAA